LFLSAAVGYGKPRDARYCEIGEECRAGADESSTGYRRIVGKYAGGLCNDDREDIAQKALYNAWKGRIRFGGESRFDSWLHTVTRNATYDHFRRRKRDRLVPLNGVGYKIDDGSDIEGELIDREQEEILLKLLNEGMEQLDNNRRIVLHLRFYLGLGIKKTAFNLGYSEAKVKSLQHRALKQLREYMDFRMES